MEYHNTKFSNFNKRDRAVWYYLYRALDKLGNTVDFLLLENRDTQAAKTFFKKAFRSSGVPFVINVDKSGANKAALDSFNKALVKITPSK